MMSHTRQKRIVVIGGGVGGIGAASRLAEAYPDAEIQLIERNKLLSGTSSKTPGRMGLGFHYANSATGKMYLKSTIRFVRRYPGCLLGEELPWSHPLRHGRYFIVKDENSLFTREQILTGYKKLRKEYAKLIQEDPENEVFGPPEEFYRELELSEYKDDVAVEDVVCGVETAEHLLNWPEFEKRLKEELHSKSNITILEDTEVLSARYGGQDEARYVLTLDSSTGHDGAHQKISADYVINSTWYNIEALNDSIGFSMEAGSRTNRLKVLVEVELPPELHNKPSMFFCMGPYCMFSNMGEGRGLMTYAPVTNVKTSTALTIDDNMQRLLDGGVTPDEESTYSGDIIRGVGKYIPAMLKATPKGVRFGIVQTRGTVDIFDPRSPFHRRDYYAVRAEALGWLSNPAMKLGYCWENSELILDMVENHVKVTGEIITCVKIVARLDPEISQQLKFQVIEFLIQRLIEKYHTKINPDDGKLTVCAEGNKILFLTQTAPSLFSQVVKGKHGMNADFNLTRAPELERACVTTTLAPK